MPGKSIVMAVVLSGWLIAAVLAFLVVAYTSFFGIGVIGILLWFICTQVELEEEGPVATGSTAALLVSQVQARREMTPEQRAAQRHQQFLAVKSTRLFKHLGMGLALIGFGGFLYYQI